MTNIQNIDGNEFFKWSIFRCLNPIDHNQEKKVDTDVTKRYNFKNIKFPVKIRCIYKIEKKKSSIGISDFGYKNKNKYPIYVSKK